LLPARVLNTLNLGRSMAARLETGEPGWTAWMLVRPVVSRDSTWDTLRRNWTLTREANGPFEPPDRFVVRYTRLSAAHLEAERHDDLDQAMRADRPEDWVVIAFGIDAVEQLLLRFLDDLEAIQLPAAVDYPEPPPAFARARTLEDVLGAA
jgi:hypothetical protein